MFGSIRKKIIFKNAYGFYTIENQTQKFKKNSKFFKQKQFTFIIFKLHIALINGHLLKNSFIKL